MSWQILCLLETIFQTNNISIGVGGDQKLIYTYIKKNVNYVNQGAYFLFVNSNDFNILLHVMKKQNCRIDLRLSKFTFNKIYFSFSESEKIEEKMKN